ncbi:hypothetical protein [Nocardia sp. NPDC057030]|uniref:hypothetical protein n=1 Tax=unclassified Nocardia TaxID=2637762 RepID=UPI003632EB13
MTLSLDTLSQCTICGSPTLVPGGPPRTAGGFTLSYGVFGCEDCGAIYSLDRGEGACPECGSAHDLPDRHVQARVRHFGADLVRLQERLEYAYNCPHSDRGARGPDGRYEVWLKTLMLPNFLRWADALPAAMGSGDFSDPEAEHTRVAWTTLLALANEVIDVSLSLKHNPGPPNLLSTHRTLIRGVLMFASAIVGFCTTLTAPTVSVAIERMTHGQGLLDSAGPAVAEACNLLQPLRHGPEFLLSGTAAAVVFAELGDLAAKDPVLLRPLLPLAATSRSMHDPGRRAERVALTRSVLDAATRAAPDWTTTLDEFVAQSSTAWRKLVEQHERLVRLIESSRERRGWVDDALDISMRVAEGPYQLYGQIIVVASKISTGAESAFDADARGRHRGFPAVLKSLRADVPGLADGIDPLLRNASAHYDYVVDGDRVLINHVYGKNRPPQVDELRFDDLLALVANLFEQVTAMAMGILTWVWQSAGSADREKFRQAWLTA